MTELILGTAEFNRNGYAGKPCPSEQEIVRILNLAWEGGIRTLDCADTYGTGPVEKYFGCFDRLNKTRDLAKINKADVDHTQRSVYYHYRPGEVINKQIRAASVYDVEQLQGLSLAIVPLNINNTAFSGVILNFCPIVRSVFDRGRLLQQGYNVRDCLSFVARHYTEGIIVGVNSTKELQEILTAWESIHGKA